MANSVPTKHRKKSPTQGDLRDWLERIKGRGELKVVDGVHWNLEIGGITQLNWKTRENPALLFDNIQGYPAGYRVLTSSTSTAGRIALTFGLDAVSSESELVETFAQQLPLWLANRQKFHPVPVKGGLVLENVHSGTDVNVLEFPAPFWREHDGGRYIGTGCAVITKSLDLDEINLGTYRIMVHDKATLGLCASPGRHARLHYENYHQNGRDCPIAISLGHHPLIFRSACSDLPPGGEYDFVGAVRGKPVEVIMEEVTGLPVPAHSEIVVAGWCPPGKFLPEGPFGEYTGYYGRQMLYPVIKVERIYHRRSPIILGSPPGRPPNDSSYFLSLMRSAIIQNYLRASGLPDIKRVWVCEVGGPQIMVISLKQRYAGHAKQAALLASQNPAGNDMGRYVIVVDEDIDPMDFQDVLWALAYRSDPAGIDIIRRSKSNPLDPIVPRSASVSMSNVAVIDACKPFERLDDFPREIRLTSDLEQRIEHYLR